MPASREHETTATETQPGEAMSPDARATMLAALREHYGERVRADEPLSRHGTFGVGGPADAYLKVTSEADLVDLVALAARDGWPLMLIGNGTNVLYADAGVRGIVAQMALDDWRLEDAAGGQTRLIAGAGVNLPKLVKALAERGLAGLEWGAGVPGTVGGAVVSNAGAHGQCVADTIERAHVLFSPGRPGSAPRVVDLTAAELELAYRHSRFRAARRVTFDDAGQPAAAVRAPIEPPEMIVGATFLLASDEPERVRERVRAYLQHRKDTQPSQGSAGSVFKNPPDDYSGRLIESLGLKGHALGGAQISPKHANFIVNAGGATAADIVGLIALARRSVRERYGVELELEVELRGDW